MKDTQVKANAEAVRKLVQQFAPLVAPHVMREIERAAEKWIADSQNFERTGVANLKEAGTANLIYPDCKYPFIPYHCEMCGSEVEVHQAIGLHGSKLFVPKVCVGCNRTLIHPWMNEQ